MVLLDLKIKPKSTKVFECELYSLDEEDKQIRMKFEPLIIVRNIRQTCRIKLPKQKNNNEIDNEDGCLYGENNNYQLENNVMYNFNNTAYKSLKNNKNENEEDYSDLDKEKILFFKNQIGDYSNSLLNNNLIKNNNFLSSPSTSTLNSSNYNFCNNNNMFKKREISKLSNQYFILKRGEKLVVKFEFRNFPEYLEIGDFVVINEPFMKAYGCISGLDT
jgi:hypothetical protein